MSLFKRLFKKPVMPEEGSTYTHRERGAYNGMKGIVEHHLGGDRFMIHTGTSTLCNIKP
jgi:hypothetical protein